MATNCEIRVFRVIKIDCDIDWSSLKKELIIQVEEKLASRKPVDPSNKTGLLEMETIITAADSTDFTISLTSQAIFSFDEMPENFEDALQKDCYPIAKVKVYEAIKKITEAMGMSPLDLNAYSE